MTGAVFRHPYGMLLSRLAWPTAILCAGILAALFATLVWTSDSANHDALERQKLQMAAALEQKLDDLEERLFQLASNPAFFNVLKSGASSEVLFWWQWAVQYFEFSGAFLVTSTGRVEWGMVDALWAGQGAYEELRPLLQSSVNLAHANLLATGHKPGPSRALSATKRDTTTSQLLSDGSDLYAVVASPSASPTR
jgi:diguanylate cyclase